VDTPTIHQAVMAAADVQVAGFLPAMAEKQIVMPFWPSENFKLSDLRQE
jgi:hypothetical protein